MEQDLLFLVIIDLRKAYDKIYRRRLGDWPHIHYLLWQWTVCYVTGYQSEWREIHHAWRTRDGDRKVHGRVLCVWRHDWIEGHGIDPRGNKCTHWNLQKGRNDGKCSNIQDHELTAGGDSHRDVRGRFQSE